LKKFHTIEYPTIHIKIVVNKADPTMFILDYSIDNNWILQVCKIGKKTILIGEKFELDFDPDWFYDKCVYTLNWYEDEDRDVRILYKLS
jgi:hypothetical protein